MNDFVWTYYLLRYVGIVTHLMRIGSSAHTEFVLQTRCHKLPLERIKKKKSFNFRNAEPLKFLLKCPHAYIILYTIIAIHTFLLNSRRLFRRIHFRKVRSPTPVWSVCVCVYTHTLYEISFAVLNFCMTNSK